MMLEAVLVFLMLFAAMAGLLFLGCLVLGSLSTLGGD